jgi:hypothetical protein
MLTNINTTCLLEALPEEMFLAPVGWHSQAGDLALNL